MQPKVILEKNQFEVTIQRLCHQLIEVHGDFKDSVIIGLQPRGRYLAHRISEELKKILKNKKINCGDSIETQNVKVEWKETDGKDRITLLSK